jgi:hypothetical protein
LTTASLSALALTDSDRFGAAAEPAVAQRTIEIGPNTHAVNVEKGEIVEFMVNGKSFTWDFDGLASNFNMQQIAPQGSLTQAVQVYVENGTSGV